MFNYKNYAGEEDLKLRKLKVFLFSIINKLRRGGDLDARLLVKIIFSLIDEINFFNILLFLILFVT